MRTILFLVIASVATYAMLATSAPSSASSETAELQWYRGNTHTHTLWSDGNDFPEMVAAWYVDHGYHFLALSDHDILSRGERWMDVKAVRGRTQGKDPLVRYEKRFGSKWVEKRTLGDREQVRIRPLSDVREQFEKPGEFLMIEGEEISDSFHQKPIHINVLNVGKLIKKTRGTGVRDTIQNNILAVREESKRRGEPVIAHLNHPNFGWGVTAEDMAEATALTYFEVYNGHPSIRHQGDATHASDERAWDIANAIRLGDLKTRPIFGVATDDSHHYHGRGDATSGRGWIQVRAARLQPRALLEAMERGDFYASTGVTLSEVDWNSEKRTLAVKVKAEPGVKYKVRFIGTRESADRTGTPIVNANGVELRVTKRYGAEVGATLVTVDGDEATYALRGDELYVRAHVVSDRPHPNASFKGQVEEAWTQPVGWESRLR